MSAMVDVPRHAAPSDLRSFSILCVDDEPNILSSLRRLLRPEGYRIFTADSALGGLDVLANEGPVDLVISDMRMPNMDGAEFLEKVRLSWPKTMRLLLTGHSDIEATIGAINRGEVHRYISKPWDEHDLLLTIRHCCERQALEEEKIRLEKLTVEQNDALSKLNAQLELRVLERTAQLDASNLALESANKKLKTGFLNTLKVFSTLLELNEVDFVGHSRRVASLSRDIARSIGLPGTEVQDVFIAGLLHAVGKLGLSDQSLAQGALKPGASQLAALRNYPLRSEQIVMPVIELERAGHLMRAHRERFDGRGYPAGLSGSAIPIGARIVSLAKDYDALQIGLQGRQRLTAELARAEIVRDGAANYGSEVVQAFMAVVAAPKVKALVEVKLAPYAVCPGMILARDLTSPDGILLLSSERVLDASMVYRIQQFQDTEQARLEIYVYPYDAQALALDEAKVQT